MMLLVKPIICKLEQRSHIPIFISEDDEQKTPVQWSDCMYPAKKVEADGAFYVALVAASDVTGLAAAPVYAFQQYLDDNA